MSDLAPFIAATLRDKVVIELKQENDLLRQYLAELRKVEIRGGNEQKSSYAQGQFDQDGDYNANPNLWTVHLSSDSQQQSDSVCRLTDLEDVEITLGGVMQCTFRNAYYNVFEGFLEDDVTEDQSRFVHLSFCFCDKCWVTVVINNFPVEEELPNHDDWEPDGEEVMDYLKAIAQREPRTTVLFHSVIFFVSQYKCLIDQLPRDENREARLQQKCQVFELERHILPRVDDDAPDRMHRVQMLQSALTKMNIHPPSTEFEQIIDSLVTLQNLCDDADFERLIRTTTEQIEELGPGVGYVEIIPEFVSEMEGRNEGTFLIEDDSSSDEDSNSDLEESSDEED